MAIDLPALDNMQQGHLLRLALEKINYEPDQELIDRFDLLDRHQRITFVRMVEDAENNPALRWVLEQLQVLTPEYQAA